jgi:tetratricopeptide (TPR) repeat protein
MRRSIAASVALLIGGISGPFSGVSFGQAVLAEAYLDGAASARDAGNTAKAARLYALALNEAHGQQHPYLTAKALLGAASIHIETSELDQAEENVRAALALCDSLSEPPAKELATALNCMAMISYHRQQYEQAEACYGELLAMLKSDENTLARGVVMNDLALVKIALDEPEAAAELAGTAADIMEESFGADSAHYAQCLDTLAQTLVAAGRPDEAENAVQQALEICAADPGENSPQYAATLLTLSKIQRTRGEHAAAIHTAERSIGAQENTRGSLHPLTDRAKAELAAMREAHSDHASLRRPSAGELQMFNEMYAGAGLSRDEIAELFAHWLRLSGPERLEHYVAFHAHVAGRAANVDTPVAEGAEAKAETVTEQEDDEALFHELYGRHKLTPEVLRERREHWNRLTSDQRRAAVALFRKSIRSDSAAK